MNSIYKEVRKRKFVNPKWLAQKFAAFFLMTFLTQVNALTVDEYTSALINSHPYFLQLSLTEKANLINHKAALTYTDWNIRSALKNSTIEQPNNGDLNTATYEVSAIKRAENTGGNISLSHSWDRSHMDDLISGNNVVALVYSQPLLQNKGGLNDRLNADSAKIEITTQNLSNAELSENFVETKIKRLIDLALAQKKEIIYHQQFNLAHSQLELSERKFNSGLIEHTEMLRDMDSKLSAEQQWLESQQELLLLKQELALQINTQPNTMLVELNLYQQHDIAQVDIDEKLPQLRLIQRIQSDKKRLIRQRQSLENKLLPAVNLNFDFSRQGQAKKYLSGFSDQKLSWNVGIEVDYPLGQNKASLDLQNSDISLARLNARLHEVEMDTRQQINALATRVNILSRAMQTSLEKMEIAKLEFLEEEIRYNNANGQRSRLISANKALNTANLAYTTTAASYQKSVVAYRSKIDKLF